MMPGDMFPATPPCLLRLGGCSLLWMGEVCLSLACGARRPFGAPRNPHGWCTLWAPHAVKLLTPTVIRDVCSKNTGQAGGMRPVVCTTRCQKVEAIRLQVRAPKMKARWVITFLPTDLQRMATVIIIICFEQCRLTVWSMQRTSVLHVIKEGNKSDWALCLVHNVWLPPWKMANKKGVIAVKKQARALERGKERENKKRKRWQECCMWEKLKTKVKNTGNWGSDGDLAAWKSSWPLFLSLSSGKNGITSRDDDQTMQGEIHLTSKTSEMRS